MAIAAIRAANSSHCLKRIQRLFCRSLSSRNCIAAQRIFCCRRRLIKWINTGTAIERQPNRQQ